MPYRTSPFGTLLSGEGVAITGQPFRGRILLRGPAADLRFAAAVTGCLGVPALPPPLKSAAGADATILGLAPTEWLLLCEPDAPRLLVPKLRESLKGLHTAVVDVSSAYAAMRLTGPRAVALLRKGCSAPVDRLAAGDCMQARIGRHAILIVCAPEQVFDLHVARSYARAFAEWLADAAAEWEASAGG